jgi:hypothetical protein
MNASDVATMVEFLTRVVPRGQHEEEQLVRIVQLLQQSLRSQTVAA